MLVAVSPISGTSANHRPRAITQCSWGGNTFNLYDSPRRSTIGSYNFITIDGQMLPTDLNGAVFTIQRSGHVIFRKQISNMVNQNGWLGVSDDFSSFALNTSDGGASGGWSITILRVDDKVTVVDLSNSIQSVEKDFAARHFCKTRGNNYEAIQ
jgi:hypothetical protein